VNVAGFFRPQLRHCLITGRDVPAWLLQHPRYKYIRAVVLSTPSWVDNKELLAIRARARFLTKLTGVKYVVDHIVPLNHPCVSGLTVPWNLQVITHKQNAAKSNNWNPHQLDFFTRA
jgi:hypothetical protein